MVIKKEFDMSRFLHVYFFFKSLDVTSNSAGYFRSWTALSVTVSIMQ